MERRDAENHNRLRLRAGSANSYPLFCQVFPGAAHNRFEHSLGTCHLAGNVLMHLRRYSSPPSWPPQPCSRLHALSKACVHAPLRPCIASTARSYPYNESPCPSEPGRISDLFADPHATPAPFLAPLSPRIHRKEDLGGGIERRDHTVVR